MELPLTWAGPYSPTEVIKKLNDEGAPPDYGGEDYGLYQIYGRNTLGDRDALLYIGEATKQTFSTRFREHQSWLVNEYPVHVYVGRLHIPRRHSSRDRWATWRSDVQLAERLLIYKYAPHYNGSSVSEPPGLNGHRNVVLCHSGARNRLSKRDVAPGDWS